MKHKLILALTLPLLLGACATPVQHNTPSGKAETTINGVTRAQVSDALANELASNCPNLVKAEENQIVCEAPITNAFAQFALSSNYDSQPVIRVTFNLLRVKGGVRITTDYASITNPGSGFERRKDWNNSQDTAQLQQVLNRLKGQMERGRK